MLSPDTVQAIIMQFIGLLRLYAIYRGSRKVFYWMLGLLVCCDLAMVFVLVIQSKNGTVTGTPLPGIHYCYTSSRRPILYLYWIPIFVYELIMLVMVAVKAFYALPSIIDAEASSGARVVRVLFRDYLIYFIVMVGFWGTDLGLLASHNVDIGALVTPPTQAIAAILGTRLLLNLRIENAKRGFVCTLPPDISREAMEFRARTDISVTVFTETYP